MAQRQLALDSQIAITAKVLPMHQLNMWLDSEYPQTMLPVRIAALLGPRAVAANKINGDTIKSKSAFKNARYADASVLIFNNNWSSGGLTLILPRQPQIYIQRSQSLGHTVAFFAKIWLNVSHHLIVCTSAFQVTVMVC